MNEYVFEQKYPTNISGLTQHYLVHEPEGVTTATWGRQTLTIFF